MPAPRIAAIHDLSGFGRCSLTIVIPALSAMGVDTEFHHYPGLGHGFGLGTGTAAEGWFDDAVAFWEKQINP